MTGVGAIMTEQMVGGSTANTTAYTFRGRMYTPEGTLVRHAGNGATSPMDDGVNIMLDVGVFCPCCAKTAENITVGGRMVSCNHVTSRDDTYDPVTSGDTKAQFARRLQHFKALESKSGGGDLRVDVSEPLTPREELLSFVSDLNDMFRPSEAPSPGSKRPASAADKSSLSSPRTPDSAGRSSLTYASSISESLETSLRSINELADEWGCRGEEPLRSGVPAPSRRRFPSQECMASRPLNGHVTFSDDVRRPRMNTASAADGVEMRRIGGAAYTANRHKRFSDDVTMFCYHNEGSMEPPVRNAMSVSPVGTHRPGDEDTGSSSDESRALDELLAELTGTNFKKQRRTRSARDRNAGSCARPNINGVIVGAPFEDSPDGCVPNLQRQVSGQTTSSMSSPRSTATTPPIVHATRSNCEQGRACYPVACNSVGPVAMRPTTLNHMNGQEGRTITFEDDESDELREIASLSRTISSGCSNDILVEVVTNALKRSVTREYSVTRSDSPEADVDTVLEHADTEIFTGDVTLRRVFSVQRERDDSCASHARRSPFSRRSTPDQDAVSGCATCEHCGFAYGSKRRACENEASHGGLVVQQKWTIKNNTITSRRDAPVTSPSAITTREYATYVESGTRQNVGQPPRPVQDWKLETVHVESANAQKTSEPEPMSVYASMLERSLESTFEEALENVTDADSSFHEEEKPLEKPAAPTEEVDLSQYHFVTLTRPPPTSSCECIADDRSNRSINDVDTETSGTHSGGDVTTDDSDPAWAEYKGEKRGSFGQLIGDTLRMTEEILATFEHIDVEDDVVGDDSTPGDSQAAVAADTPDLLRSQSDRAVEDRVVQRTSKVESVSVSLDDPVTSVQPVNGSAKTNESEDREEHTRDATRAEGHQELRREVFVANTVADSEECFFPYLEVIPPRSPRIQKAPCIVEPSPPVEEPPKREAIFSDLVVSHVDTDAVDGVTETRSRGATPDVDHLFVQASRDVAYDSGSDVFGDMCVTTDEEPDLDALVESNTNNCAVSRTPTEQEGGVVVGDHAPEVGLAVNGNDTDEHSPNTKKKRKYVGARKRVDVTQFAQFRPVDVVKRNTDEGSARIEAQDAKLTKAETETVLTQDNNENTAQPSDTQSKLVYVNERQETIVDDVSRHVETDSTLTDDVVSAEVEERDKRREVEKGDVEMRAPAAAYTTELPESTEQPEENTAADNGWRTVLCEESSELANSACQLHRTPSPSGARYVYRASSTRGNTERFDEMKRRADIDVDKAVTAAGEGVNAEEEVVSEELDIKKVTLLFTLPKELGPVLPRRPPGSTGGKKLITIRRVTRIKADGTAEVIQTPTVQTIRYTPNDKAAITTATAAQSGEQRDATPQQSAISGHTVRPSNNADGKSQNARKTDPVPIEINMKYRHTKIRKYCKVAPLKHCAVGPPSASSAVTPSGDQNGTPDGATKEMTQALLGAEDIGKTANGNVDQRDTRVNDDGHSLDSTNSRVSDIKVANGAETAITVTNSNVSHTATTNAVFPQRSTEAPVTQNGGVAKAKQPPRVKPKPNIPSWLATQLSTETVDDGEKQEADVNDDKVTEPAAGPAMHRETTTASSVMRSFKETTL